MAATAGWRRGRRIGLAAAVLGALAGAAGCATSGSRNGSMGVRSEALDPVEVSSLRERAIELLRQAATGDEPQLRANALEALAMTPSRLESVVGPALADRNVGVRTVAAMVIGRTRLCDIAPAVRPLLNDDSGFVRASAIYALRRCDPRTDPTPLASLLLGDPSLRVRAHAAFVLGELGDRSAVRLLRYASKEAPGGHSVETRLFQLQLAEAMVKLGEQSPRQTLRAALYPSRPDDLEATALAVQIIGEVRDREAIDQLIYLTAYRNEESQWMPAEIRLAAAGALAKMGLTQGSFIADEYWQSPIAAIRAQAASVYGQTGRAENLPRLEGMLEDPDGIVRVAAAAAILRIASRLSGAPVG